MHNRTGWVAAHVLACVAIVGCARKERAVDTTGMEAMKRETTAPAMAAPSAPAMTDANIVAFIEEANTADSSGGHLASTKGTNAEVKEFGRTMMRDHGALNKAVMQLAKKDSITATPGTSDSLRMSARRMADSLKAMPKGPAWDRAYIAEEVSTHQMVLSRLQEAQNSAQHPDLKDAIGKAIPTIQAHLQKAQEIQSKLGTG